jgi:hypothetical protein
MHCNNNNSGRKRDFIIGPYRLDEAGDWTTELPDRAPCGSGCNIRRHGERERKTGPGHPLLVIRCTVHEQSFTIYPPGFTPFARRCLISEHGRCEATAFKAALDAAEGERWSDFGGLRGWWSTQWRHIARLGELFGLSTTTRVSELVAKALGVDLHLHIEARAAFSSGGFRYRGRAVVGVLEAVRAAGGDVLRRHLRAGHSSGCFGRSFRADPRRGLVPVVPF